MCNTGCKAEMGFDLMVPEGLKPKGPKGCVLGGIKFRGLHHALHFAEGPKVANARCPCTAHCAYIDGLFGGALKTQVGSAMSWDQLGPGCQTAQPRWPKVHIH